MAIDAMGRLYVSTAAGIQVLISRETPRHHPAAVCGAERRL